MTTKHLETVLSSGFDESHAALEINAHMIDSWMRYESRFEVSPNVCCVFHEELFSALSNDSEAIDFGAVHVSLETPSPSPTTTNEQKQSNSNTQSNNLNQPSTNSSTTNSTATPDPNSSLNSAHLNPVVEPKAPAKKRRFKDTLQI